MKILTKHWTNDIGRSEYGIYYFINTYVLMCSRDDDFTYYVALADTKEELILFADLNGITLAEIKG